MLLEDANRSACLFRIQLRLRHRVNHQIGLPDGEQDDHGRCPLQIYDDEGGSHRFLDPVENIVLVNIRDDRQIVRQGSPFAQDWME